MITCPWCGTNYAGFRPNCEKCGGSLPLAAEEHAKPSAEAVTIPPPAPRQVPGNTVWRILSSDGWAIAGGVLVLLGLVFGIVGAALTLGIVTAFVGLPFAGLGVLMLAGGAIQVAWRYRRSQQTVEVLRNGEPVLGELVGVQQNVYVRVNGRYPWTIAYKYAVKGRQYGGTVVTLMRPGLELKTGTPVYVLYKSAEPAISTIYPHPYGYYGV
jgi:hypothetical protein